MELVIIIGLFIILPLVSVVCIVINGIHSGHSRLKIIISAAVSLLFFVVFSIVFGRVFLNSFTSNRFSKKLDKVFEQAYSPIVFEGKILSVQTVSHKTRDISILCVDIDNSNTSDFYRFDKYMGLKIKDGIAVVPLVTSYTSEDLRNYSYVKVNENHNKKVILSDYNGKTDTLWLDYCHEGIDESYMNICGCE